MFGPLTENDNSIRGIVNKLRFQYELGMLVINKTDKFTRQMLTIHAY